METKGNEEEREQNKKNKKNRKKREKSAVLMTMGIMGVVIMGYGDRNKIARWRMEDKERG